MKKVIRVEIEGDTAILEMLPESIALDAVLTELVLPVFAVTIAEDIPGVEPYRLDGGVL